MIEPARAMPSPAAVLGRLGNRLMTGGGPGDLRPGDLGPEPDAAPVQAAQSFGLGGLLRAAARDRVTGLLAHAVAEGLLIVDDEDVEKVAELHRESMAVALVLEQMLRRVHRWLADAGVDHVVLKGPAVAHTLYPDPSLRDFGDIDVLVPAEQLPRAVRLLERHDAQRQLAELAPGWDRHFAKSVTMTDRSGYEIDLHRTIAPGVFGLRIDPASLFVDTQPFVVGGTALRALSPEGQLLQACLHTAAGNRKVWLSSVCDIALLTRSPRTDLERFRDLVRQWELSAAVERAIEVVAERLDGADVSVLIDGLEVRDADRQRLDHYGDGFSGPALTGFAALPVGQWARYARALVWPSAANLHDRELTRRSHLRRLTAYLPGRSPG